MTTTDFQTLLSLQNVPCYINLSPGIQRLIRLALLQRIVNNLNPSIPTDYQSLLNDPNVNCYANCLGPGALALVKQALMQIIVTNLPGTPLNAWTPSTPITGATLIEWLKGDTLTGSSGSQISDWPASVGNDATQAIGSAQPTVLTGTYPFPVARFNGTSDLMNIASLGTNPQPLTVALAFQYKGAAATAGIINGGGSGGFGIASSQFYGYAPTTVNLQSSDTNFHIVVLVYNGASSTYAFDGAALTAFPSNPGTNGWITGGLNVGAATGGANMAQIDMGELLMWKGDASAGYSLIYGYLFSRWR